MPRDCSARIRAWREQQAEEILKVSPRNEPAMRVLAAAYRRQGKPGKSLEVLEPLAVRNSDSPSFLFEYGRSLGAVGQGDKAIAVLRKCLRLDPKHSSAWRALGDLLSVSGDEAGSREAYERHFAASVRHPELVEAVDLVLAGKLGQAERVARNFLMQHPADVTAIRILADIGLKLGQLDDARLLLERCLQLAPDFHLARQNYAVVLLRQQKLEEAYREVQKMLAREPNNPSFLILKGAVLVRRGDHEEALEIYERILKNYPRQAAGADELWPHAKIGRAAGRIHRCVPQVYRAEPRHRRGVLEPGQPEDVPLHRCGHRVDALTAYQRGG